MGFKPLVCAQLPVKLQEHLHNFSENFQSCEVVTVLAEDINKNDHYGEFLFFLVSALLWNYCEFNEAKFACFFSVG